MSFPDELTAEFSFQLDEFYLDLQEDGSRISILDRAIIEERPFPGLRPFKTSEFQLFKGKDGQAEELIKRLQKNHFLAVIGSSGTGKSSLVRAGLIPQLFGGYLPGARNKWNIAICRPGKDPVENLAIALSSIKGHSKDRSHIYENYESIGPQLNSSIYGILEVDELLNTDIPASEKPNLLIIIDQFEELFRFDRSDLGKKNIENHFVNLLLKASLNPNSSVYVIITMRSEFLGDCVKYRGLPEAINEGQYLVPQLTRNQVKEVIEGPVSLAGKKIAPGLVELLINEIEESKLKENLDQLPILQHALMRTYQYAMKQGPDTVIAYEHYEHIGEMDQALANHAEAKYRELGDGGNEDHPSKKQQIVKVIFQALTDASTDQKGGRRPTELKNIYAIAKSVDASEKEVDEVVNHFRDIDTSFIMPPVNPKLPNTGLYPDLMMDISHESLMRNWERLNKWITEEVRYGKLYKTLNERRELNEQDKSELIRGVLLRELADWKTRHLNNVTWAARYQQLPKNKHKASLHEELYKKNVAFLEQSESAGVAEIEARKKKLEEEIETVQREKWRKRMFRLFTAATIISLSFGCWAFVERSNASRSAAKAMQLKDSLTAHSVRDLKEQADDATLKAQEATKQTNQARLFADSSKILSDYAVKSKMEADKERRIAEGLRKEAESQNKNLEQQLVRGNVQNESFYASNLLNVSEKENIINALFKKPLTTPKKIDSSRYISPELLHEVNKAVEARKRIAYEPVMGLRMADNVWKNISVRDSAHDKGNVVQHILLEIFKENIFYKQNIPTQQNTSQTSDKPSILTVSKDATKFAFNFNGVSTGVYNQHKLTLNKKVGPPAAVADSVPVPEPNQLAFSYTAGNKLISFQEDGRIMEFDNSVKKELANTKLKPEDILNAQLSPDGNTLVTVTKDGAARSWNILSLRNGKQDSSSILIDNNGKNTYIRQLIFSPDNKMLIRAFSNGFDVVNMTKNQPIGGLGNFNSSYTALNFSPDGEYIIAVDRNRIISVLDTLGKSVGNFILPSLQNEEDYTQAPVTEVSFSAHWKNLLVRKNDAYFLYDTQQSGDSLLRIDTLVLPVLPANNTAAVRARKMNGVTEGTTGAMFLDENTVISIGVYGHIYLWNTNDDYTDLGKAFASVKQFTNYTYEENIGLIERSKDLEIRKVNRNYDTILRRLNEMIAVRKDVLKSDTANKQLIHDLANDYNDLAYYKLYKRDFPNAIIDANTGLSLEPSFNLIQTNLALAYLLSGQVTLAESIYRKYKDKNIPGVGSFIYAFLKDFEDLTKAGVIAADDERVKRIKNILDQADK